MPLVRVVHTTEYRYVRPVTLGSHRLMLRPRDSHDLRLLSATLGLTPPPAATRWAHDVFGNSVCYVDPATTGTDVFRIVSTLKLRHFQPQSDVQIDPVAETFPFSYAPEEFPDLARLLERHHADPDRLVDTWARKFLNTQGPTRTMDLLVAMTRAIKSDFVYAAREAEGTQSPTETLASGAGACRDYALLMMEAARALGLAARFISGYLYDETLVDSDQHVVGGGATHAWCAVYLPGAGWVEFDPTNGLIAGRNLIRVCVARTPEQAVPVSGRFTGRPGDDSGMTVDVEVTVGEAAEEPAPPAVEPAAP